MKLRSDALEHTERGIERQQLLVVYALDLQAIGQRHALRAPATLLRSKLAHMIDKHIAHNASNIPKERASIAALQLAALDQAKQTVVHERGGIELSADRVAAQSRTSHTLEICVHLVVQLLAGKRRALSNGIQQLCDLSHCTSSNPCC